MIHLIRTLPSTSVAGACSKSYRVWESLNVKTNTLVQERQPGCCKWLCLPKAGKSMLARHLCFPNWNHRILITNLKNNSTSSNLNPSCNFHGVISCWSSCQRGCLRLIPLWFPAPLLLYFRPLHPLVSSVIPSTQVLHGLTFSESLRLMWEVCATLWKDVIHWQEKWVSNLPGIAAV